MYTHKKVGDAFVIIPSEIPEDQQELLKEAMRQNNVILETNKQVIEGLINPTIFKETYE